jgi:hypothetical protein
MIVVSRIESLLARRLWLSYALLVGLYALLRLPDALAVANYSALVFPLESFYLAGLLFDGLAVQAGIAATLVSPSNAALIYPPGLYGFNVLTGKVSGLYWTLFLFQLAVGPLLYRLAAKTTPRVGALLLALLATYYFTRTNWWTPDFLIQPLMLCGVLLLLGRDLRRGAIFHLLLLGQIVGLVIAFKHNVGVFFAILCGTRLFLDAFKPARDSRSRQGMIAASVLLAGFLAFIPIFGGRLIHNDEWLFYLLAYASFWMVFIFFLKKESLVFDLSRFLRNSAIFSISALALPGLIFLAFGSVVGYGRYWHALFGMGLKFLPIWDHGIINKIGQHLSGGSVANLYHSLTVGTMFLLPLAVNLVAVWSVGRATFVGQGSVRNRLAQFRTASLGVMGVFMFFPLEGYHILASKLFLFIFVGAYFLRRVRPQAIVPVGYALAFMLLPVLALGTYRGISALQAETVSGSPVMQRAIGLPLQKDIAEELAHQLEVIRRNVRGEPYYVIDSSGGTLIGLAALEDNKLPQYYVEMRAGILDDEVVAAIKADLTTRPFVIVNADDYARRDQMELDSHLKEILIYIDRRYVQVDAYEGPQPRPAPIAQLLDFIVMRKR